MNDGRFCRPVILYFLYRRPLVAVFSSKFAGIFWGKISDRVVASTCNCRCARNARRERIEAFAVAARNRRATATARLWPGDVCLYFLAFFQSRIRQRLVHADGMVAGERPRLVVAHPDRQRDALH